MRCPLTVVALGVLLVTVSRGQDAERNVFGKCVLPLGMEEGKIPDDAITASSSYETKSVGPQNARIRQEKNGGAWCPKAQISSAIREYLEVDLTRNHLITWTETQGRFGNGQGQEYAEAFFLEYWRDDKWHQYKNLRGDRVLRGNSNTYLVQKQKLDLPFVASRVRFVPYSQHPRTVCMRVEIYGCIWEPHVASYSVPIASSPGPGGSDVRDASYDGVLAEDSLLLDGLGQLTDGMLADPAEIRSPANSGTNWVGWSGRDTVHLIFRFHELRRFENCTLHAARIPELEIETFSAARLSFSIDGESYEVEAETPDSRVDVESSLPDTVSTSIALRSRIGRFVKVELDLAAEWLLLSEVTFQTVAVDRNRSGDSFPSAGHAFRVDGNRNEPRGDTSGSILVLNETTVYEIGEESSTPDAFPVGTSQTYIGFVSGLLTVAALLLTCTAFLIKQRGRNKVALLQNHTAALLCDSSAPGIAIGSKDAKLSSTIASGLSLIRKPIAIATAVDGSPDRAGPGADSQSDDLVFDYRRRSTLYETTYNNLFSEDAAARSTDSSSDYKCNSSFTTSKSADLAATAAPSTVYASKKTPLQLQLQSRKLNRRFHEGYYAATDILTIKKREVPTTSSSPFTPLRVRGANLSRTIDPYDVPRVSRHGLRILDKLGEGNFGLVHLCEAEGIANPEVGTAQGRQTVIVRSLWRGVVESMRVDFTNDMNVLATLENPNVAGMIALVEDEPFGAVFEYSELGDLPSFFDGLRTRDGAIGVSACGNPFDFPVQIASAMKYLESLGIAHCDLAARNCIVGHGRTIKVSDHAIYCNKYDHHYFVDGSNVKIPLRWMAWEAVLTGKRDCRADVWSFAVTVWEICTRCNEIPYAASTSTELLEDLNRWYESETRTREPEDGCRPPVPPRPDRCPDDLYRLMEKCWSKRVQDRPSFAEIHRYLEALPLD